MSDYLHFCSMYMRAGGTARPKFHLMIHLIQRIGRLGNPKYYVTYMDESWNGVLAKIAATCHRSTFQYTVHSKFSVATTMGVLRGMH